MLRTLSIASMLLNLSCVSASQQPRGPLQTLSAADPGVVWEATSITTDLNGDGSVDSAHLGRARGRVYVGVVLADSGAASILDFAISPGIQDAICAEPAALSAEELDYPVEEVGPLQGLSAANAMGLRLSGGACDSIHMYWNHERSQLSWWRL